MTSLKNSLTQTIELLTVSQRPLLISHPRPDGDTIGATLALRLALLQLGKSPMVACSDPLPDNLRYLPGAEAYVPDVAEDIDIDLVVAIDMSDLKRTGGIYKEAWRDRIPLLVIDHHQTNNHFGNVNFVVPHEAATAVLMLDIIEALGVPVRDEIATGLLLGILTDTRGLRTDTTSPDVLRLVSRLTEAGGDYLGVMQKTMDAIPFQVMQCWGIALSRMQMRDSVAWTTLPLSDKERLGIDDSNDLDLGNLLSRTAEAKVIATFLEMRDGTIKVSLRSRSGYQVADIAHHFGGGGHRQAAGCSVTGSLDEAVKQVLPLVYEEVNRH